MGECTTTIFKLAVWTSVFVCLAFLKGVTAQTPSPVIALETANAQLSFLIPNTNLANEARYILIKHDRGTGQDHAEVAFLTTNGFKVKDAYSDRLAITHMDRRVQMLLRNVSAADAGTFRCFIDSSSTIIPNCGQLLIIIRKPNRPTVKIVQPSTALVGSNLHLVCEASSASLPPKHRLKSELFWFDQRGNYLDFSLTKQRVHMNTENHLVIEDLRRADAGLKFSCTSADKTGDPTQRILSDRSDDFQVLPEDRPSQADLRVQPNFDADEIVRSVIGHQVTYKCEADCVPSCRVVWLYRPYGGAAGFGEVTTLVDKKALTLDVSRINEGSYRCLAGNIHGSVYRGFYLEALYISNPKVHINGQEAASVRLLEGSPVDLTCVFDSNPGPVVRWSSPSKAGLASETAVGPQEKLASSGIHVRSYTSDLSLAETRCEDSGVYKCEGRNNISFGEGRVHVVIMCPPTTAGIPGLDLLPEYVWDVSQPLKISFVIRGLPEPEITRIMSTVRGRPRIEAIPRDVVISKSKSYDGKHYLTKFELTSRRNLDESDTDRVYTLSVESSEFTKDFSFMIRPRGSPRQVTNLTVTNVDHNSLYLSWVPGFDGGEVQTFAVELRIVSPTELQDGPSRPEEDLHWTSVLENISDLPAGELVHVQVRSLRSSTNYLVRVTAANKLGTSATELQIETADPPDESLGAGAILGIVLCVLILLVLIAAVVYFFVYKRKSDKSADDDETGEMKKSMIPQSIVTLFQRGKCKNGEEGSEKGAAEKSVSAVKDSHWLKVKSLLKKNSAKRNHDDPTGASPGLSPGSTNVGDNGEDNSDAEDASHSHMLRAPVEAEDASHSPMLRAPVETEDASHSPMLRAPVATDE